MKYLFISDHAHEHSIVLMCKVLNVSRSGYYNFGKHIVGDRERANVRLLEQIKAVHEASRRNYGSPRIYQALKAMGVSCGRHRVARIMAKEGVVAKVGRRFRVTTRAREGAVVAPDLLKRKFTAERPHQVWVSDITYIWTIEGWLYLAAILDLFSRAIVGWATSARIDADLVCTAFRRAVDRFQPLSPVIFHSDRGSQYTGGKFRALLQAQPIPFIQSNGLSCYDNAVAESLFHTIKTESTDSELFDTRAAGHDHLFDYIEVFYHQQRLHSSIGYITPMQKLQEINQKNVA